MRAVDEIRLVRENLALAMSVWRAASEGSIPPEAILGPPPEEPGEWADSVVDQYSRLTRGTANQVRASFALAALQAHRSMDPLFEEEPIDEESPDLQAGRSVVYLLHRALNGSIMQPVWDCPPRYRRFFEVQPLRFTLDAADVQGRVLKWDHFGGLDKFIDLLDYCAHIASSAAAAKPVASSAPSAGEPRQKRPATVMLSSATPEAPAAGVTAAKPRAPEAARLVEEFVAARCEMGPDFRSLAGDLYGGYVAWCRDNGGEALSQRGFGMRLTELGLERKRRGRGKHWWEGIQLAARTDQEFAAAYSSNGHQA